MTTSTTIMARRKLLFGRTLVLTALFVVAAAGSVLCVRSARADAPVAAPKEDVSVEAQAVAGLLAAQSVGSPAVGASFMQVLWGGGVKDASPKGNLFQSSGGGAMNPIPQRVVPSRTRSKMRQTPSAK